MISKNERAGRKVEEDNRSDQDIIKLKRMKYERRRATICWQFEPPLSIYIAHNCNDFNALKILGPRPQLQLITQNSSFQFTYMQNE